MLADINAGVLSPGQLADKLVAVNAKRNNDVDELKKYRAKVQQLQNQLIKANEREKRYLNTYPTRNDLLNEVEQLKSKVAKQKKLETTCLQQEKVIEKLEKVVVSYKKKTKEKAQPDKDPAAETLAKQEILRLETEIQLFKIRDEQKKSQTSELLDRAERAETRVRYLEEELSKNAQNWAKEKNDLTVRLQEHRNGILRTNYERGYPY